MAEKPVNVRVAAHTTVVELRGEIDQAEAAALRRVLVDALVRQRPDRLVIDLGQATAIDPTGIGTLVAAFDTAGDLRVPMALHCPDPQLAAELANRGVSGPAF